MANHKRIGLLTSSLAIGGAERMALRLLDLLARRADAHLLTIDGTRQMDLHPDPRRDRDLQSRLVRLSRSDINAGTALKIIRAPRQYLALQRAEARLGLDVVISFEDRANIFNMLSARVRSRVISVRHPMISLGALKSPVKRFLVKRLFAVGLRRVAVANFNSREAMLEFRRHFPLPDERLSVIPNFCDHAQLAAEASENPLPAECEALFGRRTVLACGRLRPVKGFGHLIRAFGRVRERRPDARLVIVGDGPCRPELERLAGALGLSGAVAFAGFRKSPPAWIARADVLALTSLSEGFPNVLLEAMALKTPVVAADCIAGPREILAPAGDCRHKTRVAEFAAYGVLTPPMRGATPAAGDPLDASEEALADVLVRLLAEDRLREEYRARAHERSLDFAADRVERQWLELIERIGRG
ncbi:MAG: glycosyltransferase [Lentisphaerae bacterium]|nr:glycosyltransferase [Lentisphaerota bacterium]